MNRDIQKQMEERLKESRDRREEKSFVQRIEQEIALKGEVISLYSKYLKDEPLTYEERHTIVNYDKENDAFEQMQYRLEAIDTVREEESEIDLTTKEESLCATRGEQQAMADILAVEYYQQSINERQEQKKEEKKEEKKQEKTVGRQLMM